jgi:hypothetical protein
MAQFHDGPDDVLACPGPWFFFDRVRSMIETGRYGYPASISLRSVTTGAAKVTTFSLQMNNVFLQN